MWHELTRSLRHRNYRNYVTGQLFSLTGTQLATVAQSWLVYQITQSSLMLGMVHFAMLTPILLFSLFGGLLADHFCRRRLLLLSQGGAMMLGLLLAALTLGGWLQLWHLFTIAFLIGVTQSIDMPVRQSFLADLVPRDQLANAVGLNSAVFNTARFIGPAVAGLLLLRWEPGVLFLLNGFSYLYLLYILWRMVPSTPITTPQHSGGRMAALRAGLSYAWEDQAIRPALIHVGMVSMMGTALVVLMPVFATQRFGGDAETLGWLLSAAGAGSLLGAITLAHKGGHADLPTRIGWGGVVGALSLALFAWSQILVLSLLLLLLAGFAITTVVATTNAYIQLQVDDQMRGRLMSIFSTIFVGMAPVGSLSSGALAQWSSAGGSVLLFSLLGVVASSRFLFSLPQPSPRGRGS